MDFTVSNVGNVWFGETDDIEISVSQDKTRIHIHVATYVDPKALAKLARFLAHLATGNDDHTEIADLIVPHEPTDEDELDDDEDDQDYTDTIYHGLDD